MRMEQRNQTGLFAGNNPVDAAVRYRAVSQNIQNPHIPPLARPRGHRTPTELNRQRKVETIRTKESFRGFQGNAGGRPKTSPAMCHHRRHIQNQAPPTKSDILLLTRQNPRNYTAVNNQGVVHREYLSISPRYEEDSNDFAVHLATNLAQSNQTIGPSAYYSTLCQRSPDALRTLLNNRKYGWTSNQYTGFNVRSYKQVPVRHVRFEEPIEDTRKSVASSRPQTAVTGRQLLVPQPYIYKGSTTANRLIRTAPAYTTTADLLSRGRRYVSASQAKNFNFTDDVPDWLDERTQSRAALDEGYSSPQPLRSPPETPREVPIATLRQVNSPNEAEGDSPEEPESQAIELPTAGPEAHAAEPDAQTAEPKGQAAQPEIQAADLQPLTEEPHAFRQGDGERAERGNDEEIVSPDSVTEWTEVEPPKPDRVVISGVTDSSQEGTTAAADPVNGRINKASSSPRIPLVFVHMIEDSTSRATTDQHKMAATHPSRESPLQGVDVNTSSIDIAVQSDDGLIRPADIDDIEEMEEENQPPTPPKSGQLCRRLSITDRINKMKMGEDLANTIMTEAEQRKKSLENLLEEHEKLVKSINSVESSV